MKIINGYKDLINELKEGKCNCIILKDRDVIRFNLPGVKTLMTLLKEDPDFMKDSFIFDKILGKGAAALMALGEVSGIYAELISEHALSFLKKRDIKINYGKIVPFIENKTKNGYCPIELVSLLYEDPQIIYEQIKNLTGTNNKIRSRVYH